MGLTLAEAERLGIGHEHPDHPSRREERVAAEATAETDPVSTPKRLPLPTVKVNALGQNKTEAAFDALLAELKWDHAIRDYRWEPLKLRLAGRTWYRVDFVVWRLDGSLAAVEIKGFLRDDAACKLKVAAEQFPFVDFYLVRRDRAEWHGWDVRPVTRAGIGAVPIGSAWLLEATP